MEARENKKQNAFGFSRAIRHIQKREKMRAAKAFFLAIFRNEITTILTLPISEGEGGGGHVFRFGVPRLQIRNVNIFTLYIQSWTKVSGQPRKNSITVQKEKTRRFIEKKNRVA